MVDDMPPAAVPVVSARFAQPRPLVRWLAVALAAAGVWVSFQLTLASGGTAKSPLIDALCGGGAAGWDCRSVLGSPQGSIPLGTSPSAPRLPVAAVGLAWFTAIGLWFLFVGPSSHAGRGWHVLLLLILLLAVWFSVDFIRVMAYELHQWCLGCLAAHFINFALLALGLISFPWRRAKSPQPPHPTARLAFATATAGLLGGTLMLMYVLVAMTTANAQRTGDAYLKIVNDPAYVAWTHAREPLVAIPLYPDEETADAPEHTIVIFSDFACAHCAAAEAALVRVRERFGSRVRILHRHYPQDPACNPDPRYALGGHAGACEAALAFETVRTAADTATAEKFRTLLYKRQREFAGANFEEWASDLGVTVAELRAARESRAPNQRLASDIEQGRQLALPGVPTVYLDGRRMASWSKDEVWDALLNPAQ